MTPAAAPWHLAPQQPRARRRVAQAFVIGEILCQLALLVPSLNVGGLRILWRIGVFGASLALLALLPGKTRRSPTAIAAFWVIALLGIEIFHPTSNSWMAAIAETAMYVAILAPVYWLPRLQISLPALRRVLLTLWSFYTISTVFGLLQVYYPGRFQPQLSPMVASMGDAIEGLKITLANGQRVFRPMGLTDMPGGAATAGMWALIFGLGLWLTTNTGRQQYWLRAAFLASMLGGMVCIYLSQARVMLVVSAVMFSMLLLTLFWRRRWRQFSQLGVLVLAVGLVGFYASVRLGGKQLSNRLATVAGASKGSNTFTEERGVFLQQTIHDLIPEYPLGAGLGRWGMMNTYFGDNHDPRRGLIYVEIQWQGWVLDGGLPLVLGYLILLAVTMRSLARIARKRGPVWIWAAVCLAYDVAMIAFCFDYTPFTGEMGLDFWFINALVLTAAATLERQMAAAPPPYGWPR